MFIICFRFCMSLCKRFTKNKNKLKGFSKNELWNSMHEVFVFLYILVSLILCIYDLTFIPYKP